MATARGGQQGDERILARNRRASFDYAFEDHYEAGVVLQGSEVKSLRSGKVEMVDAWASIEKGEAWLHQLYLPPFEHTTAFAPDPRRKRKLLLRASEIKKLEGVLKDRGYTLVPTRIYLRGRHVKIELGLGRGRTKGDKRQEIARKDAERETRAAIVRASRR
jgi:SsrA-binding protein